MRGCAGARWLQVAGVGLLAGAGAGLGVGICIGSGMGTGFGSGRPASPEPLVIVEPRDRWRRFIHL